METIKMGSITSSTKTIELSILKYVTSGNVQELQRIAAQDINALQGVTYHMNTLLHIAVKSNCTKIVQLLCSNIEGLIGQRNKKGDTPLHLAARNGHTEILEFLLKTWKDGHLVTNNKGDTPLHDAIRNGHANASHLLLGLCLDCILANMVEEDTVKSSLKFPQVNMHGESLLFLAVQNGSMELLKRFLGPFLGVEPQLVMDGGPKGSTALHIATEKGYEDIARYLIEAKPHLTKTVDDNGMSPFLIAVEYNRKNMIELLIELDASAAYINGAKESAIHLATKMGNVHVIRDLLKYFPDVSEDVNELGKNILHVAVEHGRKQVVEYIVSDDNLVHLLTEQDKEGNTPMHLAISGSSKDILNLLLEYKRVRSLAKKVGGLSPLDITQAKINKCGPSHASKGTSLSQLDIMSPSDTTLHIAVRCNDIEEVQRICAESDSACLLQKNQSGDTPLHIAIQKGFHELAKFLLKLGQEGGIFLVGEMLNSTNKMGDTPLHDALKNDVKCDPIISRMLLDLFIGDYDYLSEFPQVNYHKVSLLYLASRSGMIKIVERLLFLAKGYPNFVLEDGGPNQSTALHVAIERRHTAIAKTLIRNGRKALTKALDESKRSPLLIAVQNEDISIVHCLLRSDPFAANIYGVAKSPLLVAIELDNFPILKLILRHAPHQADIVDESSHNIFHVLVLQKRHDMMRCLVRDPRFHMLLNQNDVEGNTPLHIAAIQCDLESIKLLLRERKVKTDVENVHGMTPLEVFYSRVSPTPTLEWEQCLRLLRDSCCNNTRDTRWHSRQEEQIAAEATQKIKSFMHMSVNNTTLIASLVATITFTTALSLPKGLHTNSPTALKLFMACDTLAMCCSFAVTFLSVYTVHEDVEYFLHYVRATNALLWLAFFAMIVAFVAGMYAVVETEVPWLMQFVCTSFAMLPFATLVLAKWPAIRKWGPLNKLGIICYRAMYLSPSSGFTSDVNVSEELRSEQSAPGV